MNRDAGNLAIENLALARVEAGAHFETKRPNPPRPSTTTMMSARGVGVGIHWTLPQSRVRAKEV